MPRRYWLVLFTRKTWGEFLKNGATVAGFKKGIKNVAQKIKPGDYLICYLTGYFCFIGVLGVRSEFYMDDSPIWEEDVFPVRFDCKLLYLLTPETAVYILNLKYKPSILKEIKTEPTLPGLFKGSPIEFKPDYGEIIVDLIKETIANLIEESITKGSATGSLTLLKQKYALQLFLKKIGRRKKKQN